MVGLMTEESEAINLDKENILYLDLEAGRVEILMRPDVAPKHIARIRELVRQGFYDGTIFFICLDRSTFLDGQYTAWGRVMKGMEYVDMINVGEPPANPTKIIRMQIAADVKE